MGLSDKSHAEGRRVQTIMNPHKTSESKPDFGITSLYMYMFVMAHPQLKAELSHQRRRGGRLTYVAHRVFSKLSSVVL